MATLPIYAIPPLVPEVSPTLPDEKIFYRAPNYFSDLFKSSPSTPEAAGPLAALGARQEELLKGLSTLQERVAALSSQKQHVSACASGSSAAAQASAVKSNGATNKPFTLTKQDVVIQSSAESPALVSMATTLYLEVFDFLIDAHSRICTSALRSVNFGTVPTKLICLQPLWRPIARNLL